MSAEPKPPTPPNEPHPMFWRKSTINLTRQERHKTNKLPPPLCLVMNHRGCNNSPSAMKALL